MSLFSSLFACTFSFLAISVDHCTIHKVSFDVFGTLLKTCFRSTEWPCTAMAFPSLCKVTLSSQITRYKYFSLLSSIAFCETPSFFLCNASVTLSYNYLLLLLPFANWVHFCLHFGLFLASGFARFTCNLCTDLFSLKFRWRGVSLSFCSHCSL